MMKARKDPDITRLDEFRRHACFAETTPPGDIPNP